MKRLLKKKFKGGRTYYRISGAVGLLSGARSHEHNRAAKVWTFFGLSKLFEEKVRLDG